MTRARNILITGANRGLGFGFVQQYLSQGCGVFATCKEPGDVTPLRALNCPGKLITLRLDVTGLSSTEDRMTRLAAERLND